MCIRDSHKLLLAELFCQSDIFLKCQFILQCNVKRIGKLCLVVPVSYTHLDVYKRQGINIMHVVTLGQHRNQFVAEYECDNNTCDRHDHRIR